MSTTLPELTVGLPQRNVRFVIDDSLKQGLSIHIGAFFSKAVLTNGVFRYPRHRRVAVLTESPIDTCYQRVDEVARRFPVVFTHQRDLIERGAPFLPLLFGTNWLGVRDEAESQQVLAEHPEKSGLVSFIGSLEHADVGAYHFRREVAEYAIARGGVACFGKGIKPLPGKREAIAPFMFSIAMENAASDHYFSEKLIDCLLLNTVPIYYGCHGIGEKFDPRGMLQFNSREDLAAHLDTLTPERYAEMLPFALANKKKAIAERWHSHAGLFGRLAESLPEPMHKGVVQGRASRSRLAAWWRALTERS